MNPLPLVSVLMTAYNREQYIAEAIESVLNSTYSNFELIIVDDCSNDDTVNIAKSYEENDKRIKVYVNDKNLGQFPNRNHASKFANGEFILWVDSDDKIFPDSISKLIESMELFPEASFGMFSILGGELRVVESSNAIQDHFFNKPFLNCGPGGTFIKRKYFLQIGGFPEEYGVPGDMYFNLKAACQSPIVLIPFQFVNYRIHEGQELNNIHDIFFNKYRYMRDAIRQLPLGLNINQLLWLDKKNKRRFVVTIFKYFRRTHNIQKTFQLIKNAEFTLKDALVGLFH